MRKQRSQQISVTITHTLHKKKNDHMRKQPNFINSHTRTFSQRQTTPNTLIKHSTFIVAQPSGSWSPGSWSSVKLRSFQWCSLQRLSLRKLRVWAPHPSTRRGGPTPSGRAHLPPHARRHTRLPRNRGTSPPPICHPDCASLSFGSSGALGAEAQWSSGAPLYMFSSKKYVSSALTMF